MHFKALLATELPLDKQLKILLLMTNHSKAAFKALSYVQNAMLTPLYKEPLRKE